MKRFSVHGQFSAATFVPAVRTWFLLERKAVTINFETTKAERFAGSERKGVLPFGGKVWIWWCSTHRRSLKPVSQHLQELLAYWLSSLPYAANIFFKCRWETGSFQHFVSQPVLDVEFHRAKKKVGFSRFSAAQLQAVAPQKNHWTFIMERG